jgi:hypothetical protein
MRKSVAFSTLKSWFSLFPVDGRGIPTSDAAHALIAYLFKSPRKAHSVKQLSKELFLPQQLVEMMCEQLRIVFVLTQGPHDGRYRVSDDPRNVQLRLKIERVLTDEGAWMFGYSRPCLPQG